MAPPSNWTQNSSDALKALTNIALNEAESTPEKWVNPTPLIAKVRYVRNEVHKYEIYGAHGGDAWNTWQFLFRGEVLRFLFNCWFNEICNSENTKFVELLNRNHDIGLYLTYEEWQSIT